MMSVRPTTWLEGRTCEHKPLPYFLPQLLDAFCHALQSLEAAAVFSPSLGVCLLLLIWGIAPGIELHRFRHRSQQLFFQRHSGLYSSPDLLLAAFFLVCTLKTEGESDKGKEREREGGTRGRARERERGKEEIER